MTLASDDTPVVAEMAHSDDRQNARARWDDRLRDALQLTGASAGSPEAWFLGPKAENADLLRELIAMALDSHVDFRRTFHPDDPSHITPAIQQSAAYKEGVASLRQHTAALLGKLRLSAPFASMRYQGHMLWDTALPATVGLFAAMLYNQNNVAAEASPITTRLEIEVGNDLCQMLGYGEGAPDGTTAPVPWGHITSGGSVANIEALWAARNLKYAAIALKAAIREVPLLSVARTLEVPVWGGERARLVDLDNWVLLNLDIDVVAGLPAAMVKLGVDPERLRRILTAYAVQNVGLVNFHRSFMPDVLASPVLLAPATGHYSWPKAATVLGIGQNAVLVQRVDHDARLDLEHVEDTLWQLLRRRIPVLMTVAVLGSTEESAVDPLAGVLRLREQFRQRGLNFAVHADAAWGGYFRCMLRDPPTGIAEADPATVPESAMSDYVRDQYMHLRYADSITVDPHKGGYVPYPAGALCYRNAAMRDAVSLQAPVVFHSQSEPTVGVYGIEGSKPGSAAAAVWLAHRVIRPDRSGYGRILGQCMWTAKRLFCRLATLEDPRFTVTLFNRTPAERSYAQPEALAAERARMRGFVALDNPALVRLLDADPAARSLFAAVGSDQVILAFSLNYHTADGVNHDLDRANAFNERVFNLCSLIQPREDPGKLDLILTSSRFDPQVYGASFVDRYCSRMGVRSQPGQGVAFLIATTMDPWVTETEGGNFLAVIADALAAAAHRALDELGFA